ncbi:MAG: hypothetical protein JRJ51_06935 [Deltaproteobacteria bacterium]|nr:hypothetical protein [Deltaproteobacteria bacterium]MBW1942552.1 hypothetical protein [Deltaproteobacteria bacterium]
MKEEESNEAEFAGEGITPRMKKRSWLLGGCLVPLVSVLLSIASCPTIVEMKYESTLEDLRSPVEKEVPKEFPVIVYLETKGGNGARIIAMEDIDKFMGDAESTTTYSFLIPRDKRDFVEHALSDQENSIGKFRGMVVKNITPNKQSIKVKMFSGMHIRSWYDATEKAVYPKYYVKDDLDIGGGFIIITYGLLLPMVICVVSLNLIIYIVKGVRRKRK